MLSVQILTLIGLAWYAIETMKIRTAAQQQVKASLDLIKAATDQVEGMSKPCLTLWGEVREGADAILEMHGAVGNIVARPDGGSYVALNIGNGVALNVQYSFTRLANDPNRPRYVPNIMPSQALRVYKTTSRKQLEFCALDIEDFVFPVRPLITTFPFPLLLNIRIRQINGRSDFS